MLNANEHSGLAAHQLSWTSTTHISNDDPVWIQIAVAAAKHGALQLGCTFGATLWALWKLRKCLRDGTGKGVPYRPKNILLFESIGQFLRLLTAALLVSGCARHETYFPDAICAGYVFVVGLLRIPAKGRVRSMLLRQMVGLTLLLAATTSVSNLLPLIVVHSAFRPEPIMMAATGSLVCTLLAFGFSPREWYAPRHGIDVPEGLIVEPSEEEARNWISQNITYSHVAKALFQKGESKVAMNQMPKIPWHYNPEILRRQFSVLRKQKKSTAQALRSLLWPKILQCTFLGTMHAVCELFGPFSLYHLLEYLRAPEQAVLQPHVWLIIMFGGRIAQSIFQQKYSDVSRKIAIYCKLMLTSEIFNASLASRELDGNFLKNANLQHEDEEDGGEDDGDDDEGADEIGEGNPIGLLENLISTDINAIMNLRFVLLSATELIGAVIAVVGLYGVIGWPCFAGLFIIGLGSPISGLIMKVVQKYEEELKVFQDERLSLVSEYLRSIKAVKYFGWEDSIIKLISQARINELQQVWNVDMCFVWLEEVATGLPIMALLTMFSLHVGFERIPMTAAVAYTSVTLLDVVRENFVALTSVALVIPKALVSFRRFDSFFDATSRLDSYRTGPARLTGATFRRSLAADFRLHDFTIDFVENGLNVVTGASGSGKTTLLLALLGETVQEGGQVTRPEDAAFASQSVWLQAASARENIVLANIFNKARYEMVVRACCLDVDFAQLPDGDETNIGENGSVLSGGQRARVALARALYSFAPFLLLDDIFSALDSKTSILLWNRVFCSDLVKHRTLILITQLDWVASEADLAITLDNGHIKSIDQNIGQVRKAKKIPTESVGSYSDAETPALQSDSDDDAELTLVDQEVASSGVLAGIPVFQYLKYYGGPTVLILTMGIMIVQTAAEVLTNYWLSVWVDNAENSDSDHTAFYLLLYALFSIGAECVDALSFWAFLRGSWTASKKLHEQAIGSLFNVSLTWYTKNPVGRVINRLSGDVEDLDQRMIGPVFTTVRIIVICLMMLGAVTSVLPIFILPSLVLALCAAWVAMVYNKNATYLKQLVSASQSPILSRFSEGISGMTVIRATPSTPAAISRKLDQLLSASAQANVAQIETDQWIEIRMSALAATMNVCVAVLAIRQRDSLSAGIVGFCLSQATELSSAILYLVLSISEMNLQMQTFHRVREYSRLPAEDKTDNKGGDISASRMDETEVSLQPYWPASGSVEFRNVTIRYDTDGPDILKNINLLIKPGERVAIVGRTGSGKSTMLLSLLRFTEVVSGQILYDGVDITTVPRRLLRQSMSMIPQESQLFQGPLSRNIDPTGLVPEETLQKALDVCRSIAATSKGLPPAVVAEAGTTNPDFSESLVLTTPVKSGGSNFSHGQRQVLSLCRILARQSQLMLLDEATANMDAATDDGVQKALRNAAAEVSSRSLITIAHRLKSIEDYDKVVVMGSGEILEVGSPQELLAKQGSYYDLVMYGNGDGGSP